MEMVLMNEMCAMNGRKKCKEMKVIKRKDDPWLEGVIIETFG